LRSSSQPSPGPGRSVSLRKTLLELLTVRITNLSELLRRSSTIAYRRGFGLSWIEWRVMSQVGEHAPLSLNDLSELLNLDPGQVSHAVKGLATRELLSRSRKPGGPSLIITLTPDGEDMYARMIDFAVARYEFLVDEIAGEEIEQAARVLDAVSLKAQLLLDRERSDGGTPL
jgi:DNA-binding MarR family transcriptional regulator